MFRALSLSLALSLARQIRTTCKKDGVRLSDVLRIAYISESIKPRSGTKEFREDVEE